MARGNIYISLNTTTYKATIPTELQKRYNYTETDEDGNTTEITPTFEMLGERLKQKHGAVVKIKSGQRNIYVMELEASWLESEVSALLKLGEGLDAPQNTLLTAREAQTLIRSATDQK